jgi:translation initiation factor 2 alpha subunit (eIF-2alpha)
MELYELRIKHWNKKDFTSGKIHILLLEEIDTVQTWFNYINEKTQYDELSIRKVSAEDTEKIINNIMQHQQVHYLEEMLGGEDFNELEEYFEDNDDLVDDNGEEYTIINMAISEKVWDIVEKKWKKD